MEIREFVAKALTEILDGVKEAQGNEDGALVNAALGSATDVGGNLFPGQFGVFTRVDFDLAVSVESKTEGAGEAKLSVVGIGIGARGGRAASTQSVSRMAFSVPIQLPDGDQSRLEKYRSERRAYSAAQKAAKAKRSRVVRSMY